MIDPGFEPVPLRVYEWLLGLVDQSGSLIYDQFATVEKREVFPNPMNLKEDENPFPILVVVYNGWQIGSEAECAAQKYIAGEHRIDLMIGKLATADEVGLGIRNLTARVAKLFLQDPMLRIPKDPQNPTDLTKSLWRPADRESTGINLQQLFARDVDLSEPLPMEQEGILFERSFIQLIARTGAESV
jgi:hypothetical protein